VSHNKRLRTIAPPFVAAPPSGARVRTRLMVDDTDREVLKSLGTHLAHLASKDLARRCAEGALDAKGKAASRTIRKKALTAESSSRWTGTITRTTENSYGLAKRNLEAERTSLKARITKISGRVKVAAGENNGRISGYATPAERWQKQKRLQVLQARLVEVESRLESGRLSVCRGGKRLAKRHHNLAAAGQTEIQWRAEWDASRLFICADGERDKKWGNETIRWHPTERWLEIKLPDALVNLANRPHGRYRLSATVTWNYRGDEVAAQATSGSLSYDISYEPAKDRWYIDASWGLDTRPIATLGQLQSGPVVSIDMNVGHLAVSVLDCYGNVIGIPITIPLVLGGLSSTTRDARIRDAISQLLSIAEHHCAGAIVIENLDFAEARTEGREKTGNRPSRGKRGKTFRRRISGLPTGKLRDRLTQMAYNSGVAVIAVDPAYSSMWGAQHWLDPLRAHHPTNSLTGHHAASVAIGRRGLGQRLRRRNTGARTSPVDEERATAHVLVGGPIPALVAGLTEDAQHKKEPEPRTGRRQPSKVRALQTLAGGSQTAMPTGSEGTQVAEDRSQPPPDQDSLLITV
jgi:IS605 OrfB family transposase